ncbi:MAG: hypothetical protein KGH63_00060 [Candidatus Micrarchaeota archaeon]|nr:hypothetical protein [Candidatus Micrarchaeota archaeon]
MTLTLIESKRQYKRPHYTPLVLDTVKRRVFNLFTPMHEEIADSLARRAAWRESQPCREGDGRHYWAASKLYGHARDASRSAERKNSFTYLQGQALYNNARQTEEFVSSYQNYDAILKAPWDIRSTYASQLILLAENFGEAADCFERGRWASRTADHARSHARALMNRAMDVAYTDAPAERMAGKAAMLEHIIGWLEADRQKMPARERP